MSAVEFQRYRIVFAGKHSRLRKKRICEEFSEGLRKIHKVKIISMTCESTVGTSANNDRMATGIRFDRTEKN
jgi:hypothetical protein